MDRVTYFQDKFIKTLRRVHTRAHSAYDMTQGCSFACHVKRSFAKSQAPAFLSPWDRALREISNLAPALVYRCFSYFALWFWWNRKMIHGEEKYFSLTMVMASPRCTRLFRQKTHTQAAAEAAACGLSFVHGDGIVADVYEHVERNCEVRMADSSSSYSYS